MHDAPSFFKPMRKKANFQLWLSAALVFFGAQLIFSAFWVPPTGEIDVSVLTAFGEILPFCGSLIGIDYHYRHKRPTKR